MTDRFYVPLAALLLAAACTPGARAEQTFFYGATTGERIFQVDIDATNDDTRTIFVENDSDLDNPQGLAFGRSPSNQRAIFAASEGESQVVMYGLDGSSLGIFVPDSATGISGNLDDMVFGPDVDNDGRRDLYLLSNASGSNDQVVVYSGADGSFAKAIALGDVDGRGLATRGGLVYVSVDAGAGSIKRFDPTDLAPVLTDIVTGLNEPFDIDFNALGELFAVDRSSISGDDVVYAFDVSGSPIALTAGNKPTYAVVQGSLSSPIGIGFGPEDGRLYLASFGSNSIFQYNASTGALIETFSAPGSPNFIVFIPEPASIAMVGLGAVLVFRRRRWAA